tara:strand:- start:470 stop:835 length:366 start_codon:yes stop_codon:yes gene_type:complete
VEGQVVLMGILVEELKVEQEQQGRVMQDQRQEVFLPLTVVVVVVQEQWATELQVGLAPQRGTEPFAEAEVAVMLGELAARVSEAPAELAVLMEVTLQHTRAAAAEVGATWTPSAGMEQGDE